MRSMSSRTTLARFSAGNEDAPQSIRKLTCAPVTWKQVLNLPPEPNASPQPTNRNCIGCDPFLRSAPTRCAEYPRQEPDRDHDHGAQQEIAPQPVDGIEAEVPETTEQKLDAAQDVVGIEAD